MVTAVSARLRGIEDAAYAKAVQACRDAGAASVSIIQATTRATYNGALAFLARMEQEGVIGARQEDGTHALLP